MDPTPELLAFRLFCPLCLFVSLLHLPTPSHFPKGILLENHLTK